MRKQLLLSSFLGALLAAGALHAQTPSPTGKDGGRPPAMKGKGRDCSQASDPKACEERRAKICEAHKRAEASCKGKEAADRRACMGEQMCTQAPDPAKCRERQAKQGEKREKLRGAYKKAQESCKGKEAADRRACMGEQMCTQAPDPAKCREREKQRGERKGPQK